MEPCMKHGGTIQGRFLPPVKLFSAASLLDRPNPMGTVLLNCDESQRGDSGPSPHTFPVRLTGAAIVVLGMEQPSLKPTNGGRVETAFQAARYIAAATTMPFTFYWSDKPHTSDSRRRILSIHA